MNTDNSYKLIFTEQFLQELENIEVYDGIILKRQSL